MEIANKMVSDTCPIRTRVWEPIGFESACLHSGLLRNSMIVFRQNNIVLCMCIGNVKGHRKKTAIKQNTIYKNENGRAASWKGVFGASRKNKLVYDDHVLRLFHG